MTHPFGIGDFASMGVPGGNPLQGAGLAETMELVRKAWSSFALPPNMAPTVDPDEIARRIAELRAVEQWLVMNLTMLRGSIQALEIQQTTLATLRAFGVTGAAASDRSATTGNAGAGTSAGADANAATGTTAAAGPHASAAPGSAADGPDTGSPQPGIGALNPVAWWEALQRQFGEVASVALASMPTAAAASAAATSSAASSASGAGVSGRSGSAKARAGSTGRGASGSGSREAPATKAAGGRKRAATAAPPRGSRGKSPS